MEYRSAFADYKPFADQELANWRRANDEVGAAGGHAATSRGKDPASRPPSHNLASRKAPEATNEGACGALMIAVLAGCVSLSDDARFGAVEQAVKERTGADTKWTRSDDGQTVSAAV